ncbi:MarR family transcriptional regulator [Citrobacter portucalensis]|uniref:MarR family transcriptional regulator n=1 Tax=Citrobacter portucalensis TaxID=1639133 RepID=A0A9X4GK58_9ENTR|nr:MarR family transcriptional regulator [Citrobacter portucalensis]MDE9619076.1 MarR family transcriptional regulator [Citrobacter portucalensis]
MIITTVEISLLKVMAEKDIDWNWMVLDRTLAVRKIPGFSNVANIVTSLVNNGSVDIVYNEDKSRECYRVSENGFKFLKKQSEPL